MIIEVAIFIAFIVLAVEGAEILRRLDRLEHSKKDEVV